MKNGTNNMEYRRHPSYPEYFLSSDGQVFSTRFGWKPIAARSHKTGYKVVTLGGKALMIHRLVAGAFLGKSDLEVNHKDGGKTNNALENLEYCDRSYNIRHRNFGKKRFISKQAATGKYYIRISVNRVPLHTPGQFDTEDQAYKAAHKYYTNHFGFEPWRHV